MHKYFSILGTQQRFIVLIIGSVRCKTAVWSVVIFCFEGAEEKQDIGGGIFVYALDSCSIIKTWHILNCSTENQQFLALSEFCSLNRTMKDLLLHTKLFCLQNHSNHYFTLGSALFLYVTFYWVSRWVQAREGVQSRKIFKKHPSDCLSSALPRKGQQWYQQKRRSSGIYFWSAEQSPILVPWGYQTDSSWLL